MTYIHRNTAKQELVTVSDTLANSSSISYESYASGHLIFPASTPSGMTIEIYVSDSEKGTYVPLHKAEEAGVITLQNLDASMAKEVPVHAFSAHWIKLKGSSAIPDPVVFCGKS